MDIKYGYRYVKEELSREIVIWTTKSKRRTMSNANSRSVSMNKNLILSNENNDNTINEVLNYSTSINQPSERSNNIEINEE